MSGSHRSRPRAARAQRRTAVVAVLLALVVAVLGTVQAQAASLPVQFAPYVLHSAAFTRACTGPVQVRPSGNVDGYGRYTHVTVTGLSGTCGTGYLGVRTASGAVIADGTAAVTGGGFTLTVPAFTPPSGTDGKAVVTVDTWPVSATWAPPTNPLGTCVAIDASTGQRNGDCTVTDISVQAVWGRPGHRTINLNVTLSGSYPTDWFQQQYEVVLNLAGVVPANWQWSTSSASGNSWTEYPGAQCSDLPLLHTYAPAWAWFGQPVFLQLNESGPGGLCS